MRLTERVYWPREQVCNKGGRAGALLAAKSRDMGSTDQNKPRCGNLCAARVKILGPTGASEHV